MLRLFNTYGRKIETFRAAENKSVTVFTCGPSVYQPAHIGNFRTFLYEDILVRYLEFSGYKVVRGMAVTDIEDKAIMEAEKLGTSVKRLTDRNIGRFLNEMKMLRMKVPQFMPRASECIAESVEIIRRLLSRKIAYRYGDNIYFDPLKFRGFGKLFGIDMSRWPKKRRRFHKDTYPGIQWNLGDFILWHGCRSDDEACWDTSIGMGRPSWNIQDPSMVMKHFPDTLSVFCGGIDNLYRHHDYSLAVIESVRRGPMAKFWMHGAHLFVDGRKMSKSKGNIIYPDMLVKNGYSASEIRFFLMYGHYRKRLNYTDRGIKSASDMLGGMKKNIERLTKRAGSARPAASSFSAAIQDMFVLNMDNDMSIKPAMDSIGKILEEASSSGIALSGAAGIIKTLREIDEVLKVLF